MGKTDEDLRIQKKKLGIPTLPEIFIGYQNENKLTIRQPT